jgi:16S rRNA G1207 methylase RsmC
LVTWREVRLAGHQFTVATAPGVFSAAKVDLGTQVLLRTLASQDDLQTTGQALDLGCGWGALALVMAQKAPKATIWAVDVNPTALALTKLSASRAGLTNLVTATPDQAQDLRPDLIWSNPPIRVGKDQLHQLLATWLDRLAPGGAAKLVVQRHLGADSLARWLQNRGHQVTRLASAKGYRVLHVAPGAETNNQP